MANEEEWHQCHFCGEDVKAGRNFDGTRHYLSDCRPDLVEHEIGDTCTWAFKRKRQEASFKENGTCYAYQDLKTKEWTDEHTHFHKDGPM